MVRRSATLFAVVLMLTCVLVSAANALDDGSDFVLAYFPNSYAGAHFSNDWGDARSGGRSHRGTDVFSPKGTPILAVADGFVEQMKFGKTSGWAIYVRHASGFETWYMHLDNDTQGTDDNAGGPETAFPEGLAVGDFVRAGQVIGYVGDSGNAESASPHDHFELHRDGVARNPYPYLAASLERYQKTLALADVLR
jgi:peptidoglycan LD-endopeptidase LytH